MVRGSAQRGSHQRSRPRRHETRRARASSDRAAPLLPRRSTRSVRSADRRPAVYLKDFSARARGVSQAASPCSRAPQRHRSRARFITSAKSAAPNFGGTESPTRVIYPSIPVKLDQGERRLQSDRHNWRRDRPWPRTRASLRCRRRSVSCCSVARSQKCRPPRKRSATVPWLRAATLPLPSR